MSQILRLSTRSSALALWQAHAVAARLEQSLPHITIEIIKVESHGDRHQSGPVSLLSQTGVFTREVDQEVLDGRADLAVHSLKDQPTTLAEGLVLGMVLPRGPVEDILIGRRLDELPAGSTIATGSLRREAQVRRARPDLRFVGIRGNVETRIQRVLHGGAADALILARAGLERLGLQVPVADVLPVDLVVPAVSQGIVGVTCRADDPSTRQLLAQATCVTTDRAAVAERSFLRTLGGGCNVPAGALAQVSPDETHLVVRVLSRDGTQCLSAEARSPAGDEHALGKRLGRQLLDDGAGELLAACRP